MSEGINSSQCTDHCSSFLRIANGAKQHHSEWNAEYLQCGKGRGGVGGKASKRVSPHKQEKQRTKSYPEGISSICRYQDKCTKPWGACKFQHVPIYASKDAQLPIPFVGITSVTVVNSCSADMCTGSQRGVNNGLGYPKRLFQKPIMIIRLPKNPMSLLALYNSRHG